MKELKLNLKPMINKLEVFTKKDSLSELAGGYRSFFMGRGYDFEGYRKYSLHDDSRDIDWKASLRSKGLMMRIMREERNLRVFFLLDVSDSMLFASVDKLKCEYAAEAVASLCFAILRAGDSAGLVMFSDRVVKMLPSKSGIKHYYEIIKSLSDPKLYGGKFDFGKVLKFLNSSLPRNSIVIAVSDFIGLHSGWVPHLEVSAQKFDFSLSLMIRDPLDNNFPKDGGQLAVEDPFHPGKMIVDPDLIADRYDAHSFRIKERVKKEFSKLRCDTVELMTDKSFEKPILKFFIEGRKKWR
jgi:uncharacterized protein (DUF58 family)